MSDRDRKQFVVILATLDTKRAEAEYLRNQLEEVHGRSVAMLDMRVDRTSQRPAAVQLDVAARDAAGRLQRMSSDGELQAVLGLGGGRGTAAACMAMHDLAYDLPKVMLTAARTDMFGELVGSTNICVFPTVVDLNGLNRFTQYALEAAAAAVNGMINAAATTRGRDAAAVALSSFGVTAQAVTEIRRLLNGEGYEVVAFPATGAGGSAMERTLLEGRFAASLDLSITELADELVGGFATAGPQRLEAAGKLGLPQVVAPGALDMVNFGGPPSIPARFKGRTFYSHGAHTTVMRTTPGENHLLGEVVGRKLSVANGPSALLVPLRGFSAYDREGGPFYDPSATAAFAESAKAQLADTTVQYNEFDCHINDAEFAAHLVDALTAFLQVEQIPRCVRVRA